MALGIDTLLALLFIDLKISFTAALPCLNQENKWIPKSQKLYREILSNPLCTPYLVTDASYTPACMQIRNKWMVDQLGQGDFVLGAHDGSDGGTKNCLDYAAFRRVPTLVVNPHTLAITTNTLDEFEFGNIFLD